MKVCIEVRSVNMNADLIKLIKTYSDGMAKVKSQESELWQNIARQADSIIDSYKYRADEEPEVEAVSLEEVNPKKLEDLPPILTPTQVSEVLGIARETLNVWRTRGRGPKYIKVGRLVRYKAEDVLNFIKL